jgi:carboxyl-terminal processing protease
MIPAFSRAICLSIALAVGGSASNAQASSVFQVVPVGGVVPNPDSAVRPGGAHTRRWVSAAHGPVGLRLERLETLADIWAKLELHHPGLATKPNLNWDSVLLRAIPAVEAAGTTADFVGVLNDVVFAPLDDPLSFARTAEQADSLEDLPGHALNVIQRIATGIGYLDARDPSHYTDAGFTSGLRAAIRNGGPVELLIVDLRWQDKGAHSQVPWLGLWADSALSTGIQVSRYQGGHNTPTSWLTEPPQSIPSAVSGDSVSAVRTRTLFLTNLTSYPSVEVALDAIRRGGTASIAVVLERGGPVPEDWNILTYPELVRVRIHSLAPIAADGGLGTRPDTILTSAPRLEDLPMLAEASFRAAARRTPRPAFAFPWRDLPQYAQSTAPLSREERILGLVRIWKEIGTFSAYLTYASIDWRTVLREWIPRVEASKDTRAYFVTLRNLVARLNDSHASVRHPSSDPLPWTIPAMLMRVEAGVIVTWVDTADAEAAQFRVGDEILAVDGVPVRQIEDSLRSLISASHAAAFYRNVWAGGAALRGPQNAPVRLLYAGSGGRREATFRRSMHLREVFARGMAPKMPLVHRLAGNLGYIDLYGIGTEARLDSALIALHDTDGLVLDARRGNPNFEGGDPRPVLVSRFLDSPVMDPNGSVAIVSMRGGPPSRAMSEVSTTYVPYRNRAGVRYAKPLAVLVNERNQSYGEATLLPLYYAHRAIFVGSPTAGTTGGAPEFFLPGGGRVGFTHERMTLPEGGRFHGVGIVPEVRVTPTAEGIRAGRDEVLEAAIKALLGLETVN